MLIHVAHICVVVYYVVYVYAYIMHVAVSGRECFMSHYKRRSLAVCAKCVRTSSRSDKQRLHTLLELLYCCTMRAAASYIGQHLFEYTLNIIPYSGKISREKTLHFASHPRKFSSGHATPTCTYTMGSVSGKFSL